MALNFYSITQIVVLLLISILILHSLIQQMLYNEHKTDLRLTNTKSYQYSVIICYSLSNKELPHYFYSNALSIKNKEDWLPLSFTHVIQKRFLFYKFLLLYLFYFDVDLGYSDDKQDLYTHFCVSTTQLAYLDFLYNLAQFHLTSLKILLTERLLHQRPEIYFLLR